MKWLLKDYNIQIQSRFKNNQTLCLWMFFENLNYILISYTRLFIFIYFSFYVNTITVIQSKMLTYYVKNTTQLCQHTMASLTTTKNLFWRQSFRLATRTNATILWATFEWSFYSFTDKNLAWGCVRFLYFIFQNWNFL